MVKHIILFNSTFFFVKELRSAFCCSKYAYICQSIYLKINVCLSVLCRIVKVISSRDDLQQSVVHEPMKVSDQEKIKEDDRKIKRKVNLTAILTSLLYLSTSLVYKESK